MSPRPRLLLFRLASRELPAFVQLHLAEHVRCLSLFFEVVEVSENCDFAQMCDRHEPDVVLFDSGVYARKDRLITNTRSHPAVPRLGLLNADAYCLTRSVFLSDMAEWGVENFVTISVASTEYAQDHSDKIFTWPNFADTALYRPFPGGKSLDILMTGSRAAHYPWRNMVYARLSDHFNVAADDHGGWFSQSSTADMRSGDAYARRLGASRIVPTCGTIAGELVRKHLEIPACGSCLVTERTPAVERAGFVDMVNCVFANPDDVVEKVAYLLAHPEELSRITEAGNALVRTRHDLGQRSEIRQWYDLQTGLAPGQTVVQDAPFLPLRVTTEQVVGGDPHAFLSGVTGRHALQPARVAEEEGLPAMARLEYRRALTFHYSPEAAVGVARSYLAEGDPDRAGQWLWTSITRVVRDHGARTPDPVEWALYLRATLCKGDLGELRDLLGYFEDLDHPDLLRISHVASHCTGKAGAKPTRSGTRRLSLHTDAPSDWATWLMDLGEDLLRCGQPELAARAAELVALPDPLVALGIDRPGDMEANPAGDVDGGAVSGEVLPRSLRRTFGGRVKGRVAQVLRRKPSSVSQEVAMLTELLAQRSFPVVVLLGVRDHDPVVRSIKQALRANPLVGDLVQVGGLDGLEESAEDVLVRGAGTGLRVGSLPALTGPADALVVVGAAGLGAITIRDLMGASQLVITDRSHPAAQRLQSELAACDFWKAVGAVGGAVDGSSTKKPGQGIALWARVS